MTSGAVNTRTAFDRFLNGVSSSNQMLNLSSRIREYYKSSFTRTRILPRLGEIRTSCSVISLVSSRYLGNYDLRLMHSLCVLQDWPKPALGTLFTKKKSR